MKIKVNTKRFVCFLLVLFSFYIFFMHYKAVMDGVNIKQEKTKYSALLKQEQERNATLKEKQKYLDSDEYYEEIARENLGLLKSDEILFINADNK